MENEMRENVFTIVKNTAFPAIISVAEKVTSLTLPDWVSIFTLVYLGAQIIWLATHWKKQRR